MRGDALRVLALDFDGVISDSAPEAFLVALRCWDGLHPGSALAPAAAALAEPLLPPLSRVQASPVYPPFLERMPLGNRAEDYAVVLRSLAEQRPLPDQAAYDAFRGEQDPDALARFHRAFYALRHRLADADRAGWHALMAPYAEFVSLLRRRAGAVELALATAKDRRSVEALLSRYGIADLFGDDRLLDKETGVGKAAHLREIQRRLDVPFSRITFVDDKVNHLDAVRGLGVRCVLAGWGYNGAREKALARQRGDTVLTLPEAERALFDEAGAPPSSGRNPL